MKVKATDFTPQMIVNICNVLNRGNECLVKRERENIVVVDTRRSVVSKNPIKEE